MLTTRPCTATCVLDGMPVTLTFYPDNGVLRIADPSGSCVREMRWHSSWRALLDEFRYYNERGEVHAQGVDEMMTRIDGHSGQSLHGMAAA
ncbi:hypothetical protein [Paraburkholderia ginsengisoli]|uniref:Uncharacterized protein n=1 Tax=Paraburkholderia ginsengisoli TaxID=311231 RepID=A0A7T4N637_9BURK|nr:hypothetical protein [Paraburkholderia ginsengisoli]QQC65924.1 hypothetical protein I6I06_24330 [Paraburkholderia ginsengisoli]